MSTAAPPTAAPLTAPATLPIQPEAPAAAFEAARALFERVGFDEPTIARRMGGPNLFGFPRLAERRATMAGAVEDAGAALVRLLLDSEPLPRALVESLVGRDDVANLLALGLLAPDPQDAERLRGTMLLTPLQGLWLVSDIPPFSRRPRLGSESADFVFPPANQLTRQFLDTIPPLRGQRMVELCAGSGMVALKALREGATGAWATDIAMRSVACSRFNARLNALEQLVAVASDAWSAMAGETFDYVCAHPPYVPTLAHEYDYRDAGADGEQVTRSIVQGLPEHLRPGGRCSFTAALSDRRGQPTVQRIREWLGAAADEFEVVVMRRRDWDVMHAYRNVAGAGAATFTDLERWMKHFDALEIERFALCSVELRRERRTRVPVADMQMAGTQLDAATIDWRFRWAHHALAHADSVERLAGQRPRVVPGARLSVQLRADADRDWVTQGATVDVDWPVGAAVRLPPSAPTMLELCDGTRDVPALLAELRARGLVEDDVVERDVARLVELLVTEGALEIAACPLPPRPVDARADDHSSEWRAVLRPADDGGAAQPASQATTATSSVPTQSTRQ